ncbi:MAG: VOC family protein [Actinomycetota bacterium]|nr:VOC family protein [Actinomycetota bacterium]
MGERSKYEPGTFSWVDLATPDPEAAKRFYGELFGWEAEDMPTGDDGGVYTMCRVRGSYVSAIFEQGSDEREQGIPPHWNNYVTVEDVDATCGQAGEIGGTVVLEPFDVLQAGRMAVIQDPTGAFLALWTPREHIGAQRVNEPGCLTWNDLNTNDPDKALAFYGELFLWTAEKVDSDEVDYYVLRNGQRTNGGVLRMQEEGIPPHWLPYFAVEDSDATAEKAGELGGETILPPSNLGPGRIGVLRDPQGAVFAVYAGELDD